MNINCVSVLGGWQTESNGQLIGPIFNKVNDLWDIQRITSSINAKIRLTNNGKLMLHNLSADERKALPKLIECEWFYYSSFLNTEDSIKIAFNNPYKS